MAVRRFDGVNDEIRCSIGSSGITGAVTIGALYRPPAATDPLDDTILALHNSSNKGAGYQLWLDATKKVNLWNGTTNRSTAITVAKEEGWLWVVVAKAAGTQVIRVQKYSFAKAEWSSAESGSTLADSGSVAGGTVRFGLWESASEPLAGDLAAAFIANSAWSKAQVEALSGIASLKAGLLERSPAGLWLFKQPSVEEGLEDLTGNGASQTARTGTEVVAEEPPIPYEASASVRHLGLLGVGR